MTTLTVKQIRELAGYVGIVLDSTPLSAEELETEAETAITIEDCPAEGVQEDDGVRRHYSHVAYFTEYPEEGCMPLGDETREKTLGAG